MKRISLLILCLVYSILAIGQKDISEDDLFQMSLEELMQVSVASNIITSDQKQPASVTTITRKQLELSGARSLAKAIMTYVPGFFVVEDQDDLIAGFRGLAPDNNSKVLFLLNGQNMNTEWFWGPPAALLNSTNLGYIEKIEIIRGPGSVTLGQGALLGVINVVTKNGKSLQSKEDEYGGKAMLGLGENNYEQLSAEIMQKNDDVNSYFYFSKTDYDGQELRNEGWVKAQTNAGYTGGSVYGIGTRLNRSFNSMLLGNINYKGLAINLLYTDNEHDLYNFYRDRNVMGQKLLSLSAGYTYEVNDDISIKLTSDYAVDNYSLASVDGPIMGGTREDRGGAKLVANINDIIPENKMAVGIETRFYSFGKNNFSGNNFILNVYDQALVETMGEQKRLDSANSYNVMGYRDDYMIFSAFIEDFYSVNDYVDVFAALRFDMHPFWGNNISPRVGTLVSPTDDLDLRISYQSGFRGAVGLHYGGGYRQDGFLKADNYEQVSEANIPLDAENPSNGSYEDLDEVKPEKMHSIELAIDYRIGDRISISGVGFYNKIENVIDVGVIADTSSYEMPAIGDDVPGSWNGYWFFKNTEGAIEQVGGEFTAKYKGEAISVIASHSIVKLLNADNQQRGSMYITAEDNFKAYPENVSRVNLIYDITKKFSVSANYLYYYSWNSPRDQKVDGNHILNLSGLFDIGEHIQSSITVTNVLGQQELYPMNSNAGDNTLSDGTPALEKPTYWFRIGYKF
jgi:outer membrane receptor for ferrienterochelin and colicin